MCSIKPVSNRNRCYSEFIVMGFTIATVVIVIIFHYNIIWPTKADHILFSPPIEFKPQSDANEKIPLSQELYRDIEPSNSSIANKDFENNTNYKSSSTISKFPSIELSKNGSSDETAGNESISWIEKKLKSYDPKLYTEALVMIDKLFQWVNSSLTLSIITPLILGTTAGLLLVLIVVYYRKILLCTFYCLTCGCITCYCRNRRRRQNYEVGLKGKFFEGKRFDELENHYLLVPKKEEEAIDADEDSDTEVELYNKQKVNV